MTDLKNNFCTDKIYFKSLYGTLFERAPDGFCFHVHRLQLAELVQCLHTVLPSQPALLVSAEGKFCRVDVEVVHVAVSRLQHPCHPVRSKQVSVVIVIVVNKN